MLFSIYPNDLCNASNILDPIMFANYTNLFLSHQHIKTPYKEINENLKKLVTGSRQISYAYIKLPALRIADNNIERKAAIKIFAVLLDENITWEEHISMLKTKLAN